MTQTSFSTIHLAPSGKGPAQSSRGDSGDSMRPTRGDDGGHDTWPVTRATSSGQVVLESMRLGSRILVDVPVAGTAVIGWSSQSVSSGKNKQGYQGARKEGYRGVRKKRYQGARIPDGPCNTLLNQLEPHCLTSVVATSAKSHRAASQELRRYGEAGLGHGLV
jgi:hypothetical protein